MSFYPYSLFIQLGFNTSALGATLKCFAFPFGGDEAPPSMRCVDKCLAWRVLLCQNRLVRIAFIIILLTHYS